MNVTREKILQLWNVFEELKKQKTKIKFSFFVVKNREIIRSIIDYLKEKGKLPESFQQFNEKRKLLAEKYADKDEQGNSIIKDNNYKINFRLKDFNEAIISLQEEYKDMFEEINEIDKKMNLLLKGLVEFNGSKIEIEELPDTMEAETLELFISLDLINQK